jgi:octaprenyl-diphosphate synthase
LGEEENLLNLGTLQEPIARDLEQVEKELEEALSSHITLAQDVASHVFLTSGKRFRPTLLLLVSRMEGELHPNRIAAATVLELVHTATLIHDDMVDGSFSRRGMPTVNARWNDAVSVIMGDFLYSRAFAMLSMAGMGKELDILAKTTHRMSRGEMLQLEERRNPRLSESNYMGIIGDKTASLIAAACEIGASLSSLSSEKAEPLLRYGENIGLAFQIKDDVFDFIGDERMIGKSPGSDVRSGWYTLPLIAALREAPQNEREKIESLVKLHQSLDGNWPELVDFVGTHGGIEYSEAKIAHFASLAKQCLDEVPGSPIKDTLLYAVDYVTSRRR